MTAQINMIFEQPGGWISNFSHPLLVSGSCSAESEQQVLALAHQLKQSKRVHIFRAGVWKPRTSPHSFQGYGEVALGWLAKVKKETGLLTAVEVASAEHAELCIKYGIDVIWIGARTTVNPFYVQNICKAIEGSNVAVMVKNPVNPDLDLWSGAIERVYLAGIRKIIAVHRGFNTYEKTPYRNNPIWDIPIELKRLFPGLPVICDPSHICGNRTLIADVSQKAFDLGMCGLMIETHLRPDEAISDARQQITPDALEDLMSGLLCRKESGDENFTGMLEKLRAAIDLVDIELLNLLRRRMNIVEEIGQHKKTHNISVYQVKRWNTIVNERLTTAAKLGLRDEFINKLLRLVHDESIQLQHDIMKNTKTDSSNSSTL